jgi:hypothetical protein
MIVSGIRLNLNVANDELARLGQKAELVIGSGDSSSAALTPATGPIGQCDGEDDQRSYAETGVEEY